MPWRRQPAAVQAASSSAPAMSPVKAKSSHHKGSSAGGGRAKRVTGSKQQHQLIRTGSSLCSSPKARAHIDSSVQPMQVYDANRASQHGWQSMGLHLAETTEALTTQQQVLQQQLLVPNLPVRGASKSLPLATQNLPRAARQPAPSMLSNSRSPVQIRSFSQPSSPLPSRASSPFLSRPGSALGTSNCALPVLEQAGWAMGMKSASTATRQSESAAKARGSFSTTAAATWPLTASGAGGKGRESIMPRRVSKFPKCSAASAGAAVAAAPPWCPPSAGSSHSLFAARSRSKTVSPGRPSVRSSAASQTMSQGHQLLRRR